MEETKQEDIFGCGVACTAAVLNINYRKAISLFPSGKRKAAEIGFYCREIIEALAEAGLDYKFKHIGKIQRKKVYMPGSIVFIRRSKKYPVGHYLCRLKSVWMDPWINFPGKDIKAGFRKRLPEKPIYVIYPV
jgi:hypothetical protein